MAYWPDTPDTRTATVWLAIDDSTIDNGCMRFVPATAHETALRPHVPMFGGRGTSHALGTDLRDDDHVVTMPIRRGDCTVHNERVMHGSGGNHTDGFRRAYILAFRSAETVSAERASGSPTATTTRPRSSRWSASTARRASRSRRRPAPRPELAIVRT
jgi:ectoine hydroxylase-related dioxygenase (phytanoyl-CoA dioxygenase family)